MFLKPKHLFCISTRMILVTLATGNALKDLEVLFWSLEAWYKDTLPHVYLYTDDETSAQIPKYKGKLSVKKALNEYSGFNRQQMEKLPGKIYKTKWTDFMCEKINAIHWAFTDQHPDTEGVWFLDADICLFAKLPEIPSGSELALAPHYIRPGDEAKYGRYNGGFLWIGNQELLKVWADTTHTSRFFEQAALEDVAAAAKSLYVFSIQQNFGWWRLFQNTSRVDEIIAKFGLNRRGEGIGLTYEGIPLGSVHTHFFENNDLVTIKFNVFLKSLLEKLGKHPPAQDFLRFLRKPN